MKKFWLSLFVVCSLALSGAVMAEDAPKAGDTGAKCDPKACGKSVDGKCDPKACAKAGDAKCDPKACAKAGDAKSAEAKGCPKAGGSKCGVKTCPGAQSKAKLSESAPTQ